MPPEGSVQVTGLEWSTLDERAQTLLRPLIDSGVLVTYLDETSGAVRLTFAGGSVPGESERLREFIGANAEFLSWRERLHARASLWHLGGEPAELLLPENEIRTALRWKTERQAELGAVELAFIEESLKSQRGFVTAVRSVAAIAAAVTSPLAEAPAAPPAPAAPAPVVVPEPAAPAPPTQVRRMAEAEPMPAAVVRIRRWPLGVAVAVAVALLAVAGYVYMRPAELRSSPAGVGAGTPEERARIALSESRYADAVRLYTEAIEAGKPVAHERAYANRLAGNLTAAIADYDRAILAGTADDQVYSDAAYTYTLMNKPEQAIGYLTKGIHRSPSNARLYVDRASAYMTIKQYRAALADFETAKGIDETSAAAQTGRIAALTRLKLPTGQADLLPRVYIQIASEVQREEARRVQGALRDLGYQTPGVEFVPPKNLRRNEVRYVFPSDQAQAERLAVDLQKAGVQVVVVRVSGKDARPKHFELWFALPGEGGDQKMPPVQQYQNERKAQAL